jgi:hypothetical protein
MEGQTKSEEREYDTRLQQAYLEELISLAITCTRQRVGDFGWLYIAAEEGKTEVVERACADYLRGFNLQEAMRMAARKARLRVEQE